MSRPEAVLRGARTKQLGTWARSRDLRFSYGGVGSDFLVRDPLGPEACTRPHEAHDANDERACHRGACRPRVRSRTLPVHPRQEPGPGGMLLRAPRRRRLSHGQIWRDLPRPLAGQGGAGLEARAELRHAALGSRPGRARLGASPCQRSAATARTRLHARGPGSDPAPGNSRASTDAVAATVVLASPPQEHRPPGVSTPALRFLRSA